MPFGLTLFENPAVKILEGRLWEAARKHYLEEHPDVPKDDSRMVMQRVRTAYRDDVALKVREADHQVSTKWSEFKHGMTDHLRTALSTVFRMSCIKWYSVEAGQLPYPEVIAVPFQLLKHITADLLPHFLRNNIDFEDLSDAMLEALASYAIDQKFEEVVQDARRNYVAFEIDDRSHHFVIAEIIKRDAYFLSEDQHHSQVDMVVLSRVWEISSDNNKQSEKDAVRTWFEQGRKNRRNDRRFTADGWEIESKELKACATQP